MVHFSITWMGNYVMRPIPIPFAIPRMNKNGFEREYTQITHDQRHPIKVYFNFVLILCRIKWILQNEYKVKVTQFRKGYIYDILSWFCPTFKREKQTRAEEVEANSQPLVNLCAQNKQRELQLIRISNASLWWMRKSTGREDIRKD